MCIGYEGLQRVVVCNRVAGWNCFPALYVFNHTLTYLTATQNSESDTAMSHELKTDSIQERNTANLDITDL